VKVRQFILIYHCTRGIEIALAIISEKLLQNETARIYFIM